MSNKIFNSKQELKDTIRNLTNVSPSELSLSFFSNRNINYLNNEIVKIVKEKSIEKFGRSIKIQKQRINLVLEVMRHIYMQHNLLHYVRKHNKVSDQVKVLNDLFLNMVIPDIMFELDSYLKYIKKINSKTKEF